MANHKSAIKRHKQELKKAARNRAHVGQMQRDARVEEGEVTQAVGQGGVVIDRGGEYRAVGLEGDDRTGVVALAFDAQL